MKIGTKSLLFGVHQFIWHPLTVALAWRRVWHRWPTWQEWAAIIVHDWGYWGCSNMDGPEGKDHPIFGARVLLRLGFPWRIVALSMFHSSSYAESCCVTTSNLFLPDKVSVLFDPRWFYLLRGKLSGEVDEYRANSPIREYSNDLWLSWYRGKVRGCLTDHDFQRQFSQTKT